MFCIGGFKMLEIHNSRFCGKILNFKCMRWLFLSKVLVAGLLFAPLSLMAKEMTILSYNVKNGSGMDKKKDYDRTAKVIRDRRPDVVALQELDNKTSRSGGKDVLAEIARRVGMKGTYAKSINFGGGEYGIGLLSKVEPLSVKRIPLPGREEARVMLVAEFDKYLFAVVHLSLTQKDRESSVETITKLAAESKKPFFIAGDFNAEPDSPEMVKMKEKFTLLSDDSWKTCPADKPTERIDYIWVYKASLPECKVVKKTLVDEPVASDHLPIEVVIDAK